MSVCGSRGHRPGQLRDHGRGFCGVVRRHRAWSWLPVTPTHLQNHHLLPHRYVGELISDAEADVREDDSYLFDLDNKVGRRPLCALQSVSRWECGEERLGGFVGVGVGQASTIVDNLKDATLPSGWRGVLHRCPLLWQHQPLHQPPV